MSPKKVAVWLSVLPVVVEEEALAAAAAGCVGAGRNVNLRRQAHESLALAGRGADVAPHIVAWVLGCRGAATARRLWQTLPPRYQQRAATPMRRKPMPRCCWLPLTAPTPKAAGRPVLSKPSIVRCASGPGCWCASPARSASRWPCAMHRTHIHLCVHAHNQRITISWTTSNGRVKQICSE